jgi:hypothetical protein
LALTFLGDYLKKNKAKKKDEIVNERLLTANEAPPTETGRLRAAHIIEAIKKGEAEKSAAARDAAQRGNSDERAADGETEELPDPFEGNPETK